MSLPIACDEPSIPKKIKTVVIDSLNGYQAAMPEENSLILHMHELLQYLNRQGAATFMTVAQHGLVGDMQTPVDVTYLADTVILLRYFEAMGEVRRAISVIKKRTGFHETTIREFKISDAGITVGEPLDALPRRFAGRAGICRRPRALDGQQSHVTNAGNLSERAIILAPRGRDADIAAKLSVRGWICRGRLPDLPSLCDEDRRGSRPFHHRGRSFANRRSAATCGLRFKSAALVGFSHRRFDPSAAAVPRRTPSQPGWPTRSET